MSVEIISPDNFIAHHFKRNRLNIISPAAAIYNERKINFGEVQREVFLSYRVFYDRCLAGLEPDLVTPAPYYQLPHGRRAIKQALNRYIWKLKKETHGNPP